MKKFFGWLAVAMLLLGCSQGAAPGGAAPGQAKTFNAAHTINVVTTTGMIADAVKHVGGEFVVVTQLMGAGVDPHLYKASEGDIQRLSTADIIFYNGLNLEGKMGDIFVKMARGKPVVAVTSSFDQATLREPPEFQGHFDPHVWFDVKMWSNVVDAVATGLGELAPAHVALFRANAKQYAQELSVLDAWCHEFLAKIPQEQRVLITAHDAFGYFGRAYGVEVLGLQGISTVAEFGLKDIERIVNLLVERKIRAVFVESSVPRRSIEAVVAGAKARGHDVQIGGQLYSDAMGQPGTPDGTYVGMVRANVKTIVDALSGQVAKK